MSWEESMFAVFDDLEQQASGLHLAERDAEVADLALAEYSQVSLAARLHASLDHEVQVRLLGGRVVSGRLARLGLDWFLVVDGSSEWVVLPPGAASISGLSARADSEETWSVTDRLPLRSVLRRLATAAERCVVHLRDDRQVEGSVGRVGRDFFELSVGDGPGRLTQVVPDASVAALQGRR
jgi:small nuclear ribonucleoprotein (snRNP)-like protein